MSWLKQHAGWLTALALFITALVPRVLELGTFATADEAKWVYRSAQFLAALVQGNLAGTAVNLTPAVTTTWLGALGLAVFHALGGASGVPLVDWLQSLPEFRADMDILVAVRWPMVLFGALAVTGLYALARRLVDTRVALACGLLLAFDPQMIALSRLLGHDAPAGLCAGLALLAFLLALQRQGQRGWWGWTAVSGTLAGLAMLSKSPAFFLAPFVAVVTLAAPHVMPAPLAIGQARPVLLRRLAGIVVWGLAAWLVFVALWPAAWQRPFGAPYDVVHNAFLSATDAVEPDAEGFWQVPDLGVFYYPVNGLFKLSPLATLGLAVWAASLLSRLIPHPRPLSALRRGEIPPLRFTERGPGGEVSARSGGEMSSRSGGGVLFRRGDEVAWLLLAFVVLFTVFMTLGGKRSNRYLLPAWPALYLLAGLGLARIASVLSHLRMARIVRAAIAALLVSLLLLPAVVTYPYYLTYLNPFAGGALTAPRVVKIGWGEGLDQVGHWLQSQPDPAALRVGSVYPSALSPFYQGRLSGVTAGQLDYVVLYIKSVQEGDPSPSWLRYFLAEAPLMAVRLAGIDYARVYAGPTMQPAMANEAAFDIGILPKPLFFRLDRPYAGIGEPLEVTVLWLAEDVLPDTPTQLTVQPAADLGVRPEQRSGNVLANAEAPLERRSDGLVLNRYTLRLPPDLPRASYGLLVDGRPLGTVEARLFTPPPLDETLDVTFGDQVRLLGTAGAAPLAPDSTLELVWQAAPRAWADYTVFMHLLDERGERIAGVDLQPPAPTSGWARGEVVVMAYVPGGDRALPIPRDLPAGDYRLVAGLYDPATGARLPVIDHDGAPAGDSVTLQLQVTAAP